MTTRQHVPANDEDTLWLLNKIKTLEGLPKRWPTHQNIWAGSYDVWHNDQDRIDAIEIPRRRMQEAEDADLITNETKWRGQHKYIVWSLTHQGEQVLEDLKEGKPVVVAKKYRSIDDPWEKR